MDQFSYLSVLLSIVIGLAITQILKGYRGIVLARRRVDTYWPVLLWSATLLMINVQSWWAMFTMRNVRIWTFAGFAVVLAQTILQYMLSAIVLPDFFGDERVDLREHYFAHRRWFFGLAMLVLLVSLSKELVLYGYFHSLLDIGFQYTFIAMSMVALLTRAEWYHKLAALIAAALYSAYVILLFAQLR
jgi:hypothetical protein